MPLKDAFEFSSRAVVAQDVEIRGAVSIGPGTVVHPRATILALHGPIIIGNNNILEEGSILVNRYKTPLVLGDLNLLATHSRVECSVGSFNTFLPKSSAPATVRITDCCTLGAGCALLPTADADAALAQADVDDESDDTAATAEGLELLEPYTTLYLFGEGTPAQGGRIVKRRVWDGSGEVGERDLRMKHVEYLKEMLPRVTRMRAV